MECLCAEALFHLKNPSPNSKSRPRPEWHPEDRQEGRHLVLATYEAPPSLLDERRTVMGRPVRSKRIADRQAIMSSA